ncbi:MAG: alkyl/aryl-sulfatase [Caulobacterales bacterium]
MAIAGSNLISRPVVLGIASLALCVAAAAGPAPSPAMAPKPATAATRAVQAAALKSAPTEDQRDFEFANRGFIATWPDAKIPDAKGGTSFDLAGNDFIDGPAPDSVNPALWRQNRVMRSEGLFRLTTGLYQVRNFDNSNVSFIETPKGWIVVDPLTVSEVAQAAFELVKKHVADKPVLAVIYTHSHSDHFAGAGGIVSQADVAAGKVQVIAPKGFVEEVVSEWVIAGPAMGRRAMYQFGYFLPRGPTGHVGMGMGVAIAAGQQTFIAPTREITATGERVSIDGVELVFQLTPDAEAPAEMAFYIPSLKALCTAEIATSTLHNVQTLRGAKVRDAKAWADYLTEQLRLWGETADLQFASHHWPQYGGDAVRTYLSHQRDAYKFIHDQSVRMMNGGATPLEIAETLELPPALQADWSVRGFYGTVSHNAKAIYDRYMGWYDGVPARLNPHPPVEQAKRMVATMGGTRKVLDAARKAFADGDYRWSAELANYAVFAGPKNQAARSLLADSYEQMGYQSESAIWRNIYLTGARELRQGGPDLIGAGSGPSYLLTATPFDVFLDMIATRLVPERAGDARLAFRLTEAGSGVSHLVRVENAVLVHETGRSSSRDAPTLTAQKPILLAILLGRLSLADAIRSGQAKLEGEPANIDRFVALLDHPSLDFAIIEP